MSGIPKGYTTIMHATKTNHAERVLPPHSMEYLGREPIKRMNTKMSNRKNSGNDKGKDWRNLFEYR